MTLRQSWKSPSFIKKKHQPSQDREKHNESDGFEKDKGLIGLDLLEEMNFFIDSPQS